DRGSQALLSPCDVATPKRTIARTARVSSSRHQEKIVSAVFASDVVSSLHVHSWIGVTVLANRPPVEHRVGTSLRNVLLAAIKLECCYSQLEKLGNALLPICFGRRLGEIDHPIVVLLWRLVRRD